MNSLLKSLTSHRSSTRTRLSSPLLSLYSTTSKKRGTSTTTTATRTINQQQPPPLPVSEWPRPTEIPYQTKLANVVNLIGYVNSPVQSSASADGKFWSATVITQDQIPSRDSPHLWIPIIFEDDLAHTAARHLNEKDCVYVRGQLITDPPPLDGSQGKTQPHVQVMVRTINFVQGAPQSKISSKKEQQKLSDSLEESARKSMKLLLSKPLEPTLNMIEVESKDAAQGGKMTEELVFANDSMHDQFQEKIKVEPSDHRTSMGASTENGESPDLTPWKELLADPKKWWDYRASKLNQVVSPKYPDFKHKDSGLPLWINRAPKWFLSEVNKVEFDVPDNRCKQSKQQKGDESWKDLVENPDKWWDNRLTKKNVRAPDFRHKESREGLWIDNSPTWVLSKLPPLRHEEKGSINKNETLVS